MQRWQEPLRTMMDGGPGWAWWFTGFPRSENETPFDRLRAGFRHAQDRKSSFIAALQGATLRRASFPGLRYAPFRHPTDEDLSLHPSEQQSLAGDPESMGTPDRGYYRPLPPGVADY